MNNKLWSLGLLGTALATTAPVVLLSSEGTLRDVEVIFYDNTSGTPKSVKVPIDNLGNSSYFKYKNEQGSFKWISYISDPDDRRMYMSLANIAVQYIRTQHQLNIIKYGLWQEDDDGVLKNNNCCPCCTQAGQAQCRCAGEKCCYMCLGCYSDNATADTNRNCCTSGNGCTWTQFKKNQRIFKNLRDSLYSGYHNTYLSPVQANIKFTDNTFDEFKNELKNSDQSATEYKPFIGSLTYGFVDYGYRQTTYKSGLLRNVSDLEVNITDGSKDVFFSTIPQKFSFAYKLKAGDDISGVEAFKKGSIAAALKKVDKPQKVIDEYRNKKIESLDVCCKASPSEEELMKCLLGRTYVFLSKTNNGLQVAEIIKNMGICCPAQPSS